MTDAFILKNETLLCSQTSTGWMPVRTTLPLTDRDIATEPQRYQSGRVELLANSSAPNHSSHHKADASYEGCDAPAISAITYDYALDNGIDIPILSEIFDITTTSGISTESMNSDNKVAFVPYRHLIAELPFALASQISQAIQLLRWQADTQFCSRCGTRAIQASLGERAMVCPNCHLRQYPRVQPCVITAITRDNPQTGEMQILMAHHHRYGKQTLPLQYGLIAGFVEVGESLEHAVVREVLEEVGIRLTDIRYVSSQPWPFPSNLMLGFRACYASGDLVLQEDELSHADFFDVSHLPKIPPKGSIAYALIAQITQEQGVCL